MPDDKEWWREFFSGAWLELQRQYGSDIEQNRAEADFIEEALRLEPDLKVLDIPCGEGRIAIELAARGHRVTGVDMTKAFLDDARRHAEARGLKIDWLHGDMRNIAWEDEFDAAVNFWGSFGYFDDEGNAEFAEKVARALKPGGRFLIEGHLAETILPKFQEKGWATIGDVTVLEKRTWNAAESRVDVDWTFIHGGRTSERHSSIRIYSYRELRTLLEGAGFSDVAGYEGRSLRPLKVGSTRAAVVAVKGCAER